MSDLDSARGPPSSRTPPYPPLETSTTTPPDARHQSFDLHSDALNFSPKLAVKRSNGEITESQSLLSSLDLSVSRSDSELSPRRGPHDYRANSFRHPSLSKAPNLLSVSLPHLSYLAGEPETGKYRPLTRSPSDGSDVRWYFCQTILGINEAAASVPATEVVGKGEYFRFSKGDSDTLEAAFLLREEELVRAWWEEYAENGEGPTIGVPGPGHNSANGRLSEEDIKDFESSKRLGLTSFDEEENVGVLVKGGLYEVDLRLRRCSPVYWRGDHRRVLRGHWFARKGGLDWLPLREDVCEQLEIAYVSQIWRRRRFQPSGLYAARVNLHGATQGLHALFTGEDHSWEAWLCVDKSGVSFVLGLRGSGIKLRRGFALPESIQPTQDEIRQQKEEDMDDYASKVPVRHVVFMVHGIGQRLEKANLVDDVGAFRRTFAMLAEQHLTQYQREAQRILFIPCQWRRGLKLGGESSVEDCTLEGVRALRTMLSATVHDVLYYMSPVYCQDIIDSVSHSLNRLYGKFIKRNPNYDGKVSLYGHSLGSVLSYDILCHQTHDSSTSVAPIVHLKQETEKDVDETSSNTGSSMDDGVSSCIDDFENIPEDGSSNGRRDWERFQAAEKSEADDELKEDDGQHELTEVEALKAEVKMLQEKLLASTQLEDVNGKPNSSSAASSCEELGNLNKSENFKAEKRIARLEDRRAKKGKYGLPRSKDKKNQRDRSKKHFTPRIAYTKLDFKVETFYAVGSPLGVFLSLRNIRIGEGMGQEYWQDDGVEEEMPAVKQMMNIFHPYDPVAYRIEPLICREFVKRRPTFIPHHTGGKRLHIVMQEFQEDLSARSKAVMSTLSSARAKVAKAFFPRVSEKIEDRNEESRKEKTYGELMMERLTGGPGGRLDYQLQDATFEHQYIAVLSSHTGYWQDVDTALFILRHLYKDVPIEAPTQIRNNGSGVDGIDEDTEVSEASLEYAAQTISLPDLNFDSEDVSLTFSSKDTIANALADANKVKSDWMR